MDNDRISALPDDLISEILSRMPLRDAVRTSLLSTDWRYKWAMVPNLVFDEEFCPRYYLHDPRALEGIIDHVLLLHFDPIHKFELSHSESVQFCNIDRWITHLSRRSIKELVLETWDVDCYRIPSCMFSCQSLTHLLLSNCLLSPPPPFKGFAKLKSLELNHVELSNDTFQKLISGCPVLENLSFLVDNYPDDLIVDAPNLRFFESHGNFAFLTLKNTICIEEVSIRSRVLKNSKKVLECLANLPTLRSLALGPHFVEQLCLEGFSGVLPNLYPNLLEISIYVDFNSLEEVLAVLYILQSMPTVREVEIQSWTVKNDEEDNAHFWIAVDMNCSFSQLRRMDMINLVGVQYEQDFICYMLSKSPALESMTIKPTPEYMEKMKFAKELLSFRRASPRAKVIFVVDESTSDCCVMNFSQESSS